MHEIADPPSSTWRTVSEFSLPNRPGSDKLLQAPVATALKSFFLSASDLARLMTFLVEAVLDVIDHQPQLSVSFRLLVADRTGNILPKTETPSTTAAGIPDEHSRGWGFFLVTRGLDQYQTGEEAGPYFIELFLYPEGDL